MAICEEGRRGGWFPEVEGHLFFPPLLFFLFLYGFHLKHFLLCLSFVLWWISRNIFEAETIMGWTMSVLEAFFMVFVRRGFLVSWNENDEDKFDVW